VELYVKIRRAVMVEGRSEREVSRYFGVHRKTVKKMCQCAASPGYSFIPVLCPASTHPSKAIRQTV